MTTIGSVEAGAEFAALLKRVAGGEQILITEDGKPIARLVPAAARERPEADNAITRPEADDIARPEVDDAIAKLKALRRGTTLGDISWRELRDAGRR